MSPASIRFENKQAKEWNEPQKNHQIEKGGEEQQMEEDSHTQPIEQRATFQLADNPHMQHSFATREASLASLNDSEESPGLIQHFVRNNNQNNPPKNSLFRRFQLHTSLTTKRSSNRRSDLSAITLDTALEPAIAKVPLLKDMTTVFSSSVPNVTTTTTTANDASRMRRASLSAALPTAISPEQRQQRRASVAGGGPCLDSSLSNARQPRRLIEYPATKSNNAQELIMSQRRPSSPRPKNPTTPKGPPQTNNSPTLLPFVGSRPLESPTRQRPDPHARTPTDRDTLPLATYLQSKKLEPTGRNATGACSTRIPETSSRRPNSEDRIAPASPASSKKSLPSSNRPLSSPSSYSKQSLSSLEKTGSSHDKTQQKRCRDLRPKLTTKPTITSQPNVSESTPLWNDNGEPQTFTEHSNVPSPRRLRPDDNNRTYNGSSCPMEPSIPQSPTSESTKKSTSPLKIRPTDTCSTTARPILTVHDVDLSASSLDKPFVPQSVSKKHDDSAPSPRRKRTDPRNALVGTIRMSIPVSGLDSEKTASPSLGVSKKTHGENTNKKTSLPVRSPRKHQTKSVHQPDSTLSPKKTNDITEISPSSVKKRIKSPQGKRKGKSASMNHLTVLTTPDLSSNRTSSKIIQELPTLEMNTQQPLLDLKSEVQLSKNCLHENPSAGEQSHELPMSGPWNIDSSVDARNQSPHRSSRTSRVATTDPLKMIKHENGTGTPTSPLRRKRRASSIGHAPVVMKSTFAVNKQQAELVSSRGLPRMEDPNVNNSEVKSRPQPNNKVSPSPRRRRRRVTSMPFVSATTLNRDDVKSSKHSKNRPSTSRGGRAMSMQHVSIPTSLDKTSTKLASLKANSQEAPGEMPSQSRNRRLRRCSSSDFISEHGI